MRRYIKSNYHIRAMISRVKYYRRRKAEYLKQRRKTKNINYFLFTYNALFKKNYARFFKFQNKLNKTLLPVLKGINALQKNSLKMFSRRRRHELDDYDEDENENENNSKKHHSEGLYYTNSRMTEKEKNLLITNSILDNFLWKNYRVFYNSTTKLSNRSIFEAHNSKRLSALSQIILSPFIRINYDKLYRMDRIKFPIVKYFLKVKTISTFAKFNYHFRKMSCILRKKLHWKKKFIKNSLWRYSSILKTKIINNTKIIVQKTYNNFYITAINRANNVIIGYSAGCSGLTGSKRLSPVSAEKVAKKFINKFFDKVSNFANVDIYIKSKRIDASIRNILNVLIKTKKIHYSRIFKRRILIRLLVRNLILVTTFSHNGVRKRHQRRV